VVRTRVKKDKQGRCGGECGRRLSGGAIDSVKRWSKPLVVKPLLVKPSWEIQKQTYRHALSRAVVS